MRHRKIIALRCLLVLLLLPTGCGQVKKIVPDSVADPSDLNRVDGRISSSFFINTIDPNAARQGEQIKITGRGLGNPNVTPTIAGAPVDVVERKSDEMTITVPAGNIGLTQLTLTQNDEITSTSFLRLAAPDDLKIIVADEKDVCTGEQYYDLLGVKRTGTGLCVAAVRVSLEDKDTQEGLISCSDKTDDQLLVFDQTRKAWGCTSASGLVSSLVSPGTALTDNEAVAAVEENISNGLITYDKIANYAIKIEALSDMGCSDGQVLKRGSFTAGDGTTETFWGCAEDMHSLPTTITLNSVSSQHIEDGTIVADDIQDGAISAAKLAPFSIAASQLPDNIISSLKIADGSVSSNDIAPLAIDSSHIQESAINSTHIADGSIQQSDLGFALSSQDIEDGSVKGVDLEPCPEDGQGYVSEGGTMKCQDISKVPGLMLTTVPGLQAPLDCSDTANSGKMWQAGASTYICAQGERDLVTAAKHIIFITSSTLQGNFGGLSQADTICQSLAQSAEIDNYYAFKAIVGDSNTSIRERIRIEAPVFRTDGVKLAGSDQNFWDTNSFPMGERGQQPFIDRDENGIQVAVVGGDDASSTSENHAWTGSNKDNGSSKGSRNCNDWTTLNGNDDDDDDDLTGDVGEWREVYDHQWVNDSGDPHSCSSRARLYCISQ